MEKLRQSFAEARDTLALLTQKLEEGLILTDQDCFEVVRQVNALSQEQKRLVKQLEEAGGSAHDCTSLDELEKAVEEQNRREQEQARLLQLREMVDCFLSIQASSAQYAAELARVQSELRNLENGALLKLEERGELEPYRSFLCCLRAKELSVEDVRGLTDDFGYQLPFALLEHGLILPEDGETVAPPSMQLPSPVKEPWNAPDFSAPASQSADPTLSGEETEKEKEEEKKTLVRSILPIRTMGAKAEAFRGSMKKLPVEARILLPALSQLGAMDLDLLVEYSEVMGWSEYCPDKDGYRVKLSDALQVLMEKGFLAGYLVEDCDPVYCLTNYSYECLHKATILKDVRTIFAVSLNRHQSFSIGIGNHKLVAREEMDEAFLREALQENEEIACFLSWLLKNGDSLPMVQSEIEDSCKSLIWRDDHYVIHLPLLHDPAHFAIAMSASTANTVSGSVLLLSQNQEEADAIWDKNRFLWWNGTDLNMWEDDHWDACRSTLDEDEEDKDATTRSADDAPGEEAPADAEEKNAKKVPKPEAFTGEEKQVGSAPQTESVLQARDLPNGSAQQLARALLTHPEQIQSKELLQMIVQLLAEGRFAEAEALTKTLAQAPDAPTGTPTFYQTLRQSVQAPGTFYQYSSDVINHQQSALPEEDQELRGLQQAMILATLLWAMAFPTVAYDHRLYNNARMTVGTMEDQTIESLVTLLSQDLKELSFQNDGLGFSPAILSALADNGERERQVAGLCSRAAALERTPTSTINITGLETCLKQMVGPSSEIGRALQVVCKDNREKAGAIRAAMESLLGEDFQHSDAALENYIDQCWHTLRREDSHVKVKHLDNDTPARRLCKKALSDRISVICGWLDIVQLDQGEDFQRFRERYARVMRQLKDFLRQLTEKSVNLERSYDAASWRILQRTAERMLAILDGSAHGEEDAWFYHPLCLTPELILGGNGENLVVSQLYGVPGLEPWVFLLRAVAVGPEEPEEILRQIHDYRSERWYRNFGTEALLTGNTVKLEQQTQGIQIARRDAEQAIQTFQSNTRLNRAYGKIQEHEMETAFSALDIVKNFYFQNHNYASFKIFIQRIDEVLEQKIETRAAQYERQIQELAEAFDGTEMLEAIRRALESRNFNSVDSYINQLQSGVTKLPENEQSLEQKLNYLAQFQEGEESYFQVCQQHRSSNPARWGERALENMAKKHLHWTSPNEKKKGCTWLNSWIISKGDANNSGKVRNILTGLGFRVKTQPVWDDSYPRAAMYEVFRVSVEKTSPNLKDYAHPIYKFGTDLSDPMYVVCLYGCKGASTLINVMTGDLQLSGSTIVLMDGSLTVADRHLVAAKFKADTSGQSPFLLIDRVLLLYLASLDEGDRQRAMLHCTLPYTFEVLYGSGSGAVPEEMFIGRVSEMNDLRNAQGPSLVYGGRQLGKTALLNRASKTLHDPQNREYSFCVDVKDEGSDTLLAKVVRNLEKLDLLEEPCDSLGTLCETLQGAYEKGKIHRLQIFVDEADELFREFGERDYKELRPFIVLRDNTGHHVKFVFAGTHNVAATDKADMENSNLVHMGKPLCIEPLSVGDAVKLIRIPMSYLGFEVGDAQIELILSNTNSYPGLIHMFCNALIQSVCRDYDNYYSAGLARENPPYRISDEQMRAVFKEKDIRKEIGTRVMATIKLNRKYRIISCLLAHMVYEDQASEHSRLYGYSARELLDYNLRELQIHLLERMPEKDLEALLDEMARMGILWKNAQTRQFRFRQQDFLYYIGTSDQVLEQLWQENVEEQE